MSEFTFSLVLHREPTEEELDRLYEAGCDDVLFGSMDQSGFADFTREAPSLAEAIANAIAQVRSVAPLDVLRIEPDDLVTASEIAERIDKSREYVRLLAAGERGDGFPLPAARFASRMRLWHWSDIARWRGDKDEAHQASVIAAFNAVLEYDRAIEQLPDPERDSLFQALGRLQAPAGV